MNVRTACSRGRRARALVGIAALLAALSGCDRDHPVLREQVFVAGGYDLQGHYSADVQFYDVQTRTFVSGGTMRNKRIEYGAVLLPSGLILIAGGSVSHEVNDAGLDAAELYSPSMETARPTKRPLNVPRAAFTATLLKSGKVLLTGGSDDSGIPLASVEIYDPQTDTFAPSQCTMSSLEHMTSGQIARGSAGLQGERDLREAVPGRSGDSTQGYAVCRGDLSQHSMGRQGDDAGSGAAAFDMPDSTP